MARFSIDLLASPRRWAAFATGTQRVIECDLHDSSAVVEQLRAQGWESTEIGTDSGRAAIQVHRDDVEPDTDTLRGALEESGFEVSTA